MLETSELLHKWAVLFKYIICTALVLILPSPQITIPLLTHKGVYLDQVICYVRGVLSSMISVVLNLDYKDRFTNTICSQTIN